MVPKSVITSANELDTRGAAISVASNADATDPTEGSLAHERQIRGQIKPVSEGRFSLLNAAERLFAQHGYYGASMRDITTRAGVPHGLATYHFSSKDDLFRQVVARRAGALLDGLRDGLQEAGKSVAVNFASGQPAMTVRAVITAYVGAHMRFAAKSAEQACYMRLTQQLIAIGRRRELTGELAEAYQPVADAYLQALAAACPRRGHQSAILHDAATARGGSGGCRGRGRAWRLRLDN
jgi:AcrR family transcriptional regulator